jgi:hypothetical protein
VNASSDDFESVSERPSIVMRSDDEPISSGGSIGFVATQPVATSSASDAIGVDSMRDAMIANFEQADLDVPAFLRKRGETM